MKSALLISASLVLIFSQKLQAQTFGWLSPMNSQSFGKSIAVDQSGNVYTAGRFRGTVDFNPGPGVFNLISAAGSPLEDDIYIQKLDASGNFIWAKQFSGLLEKGASKLVLGPSNSIYITGSFFGTVDFNTGPSVNSLTASGPGGNLFIAKLDTAGNYIWARSVANSLWQGLVLNSSIAVDGSGNSYTTSSFGGTTDFDPGLGNYSVSTTTKDMFILKLDGGGDFIWVKTMVGGSTGFSEGTSITIDAANNILTTGTFSYSIDIDPGVGVQTITSVGGTADVFMQKLDASGNFVWGKNIGGSTNDFGSSISVDGQNNVYIGGQYQLGVDLDPGPGTFYGTGSMGYFNLKLNAGGDFIWAKCFNFSSFVSYPLDVYQMTADQIGNVYSAGTFYNTVDFDPGPGTYTLTAHSDEAFVTKLDSSGNLVFAVKYGPNSSFPQVTGRAFGLTINNTGDVFTTGTFSSNTFDFDPGAGVVNATAAGTFVHKLSCSPPTQPASIVGNSSVCAGTVQTYSVSIPGATSFVWTLPSGWTGTSISNSLTTTAGSGGGVITVTGTNSCGTSIAQTLAVTVTPSPLQTVTASGPTTFCSGSNVVLTAPSGTGYTYQWQKDGLPLTGATSSTYTSTVSGIYTVITSNGVCSPTSLPTSVTVNHTPSQPTAVIGPTTICAGSVQTYSVTPVSGATSYTWTLPSAWTGTSNTNSISVNAGTNGGWISVMASNSCGVSLPQTTAISMILLPPVTITPSGTTTICPGNNILLNASGNFTYQWQLNNVNISGATSSSYNASQAGTYTVIYSSGACASVSSSAIVTIGSVPGQPLAITGPSNVCVGNSQIYTVPPVSGATSYNWTLPSGWTGTSATNTISVNAGTNGGNISVAAVNNCGAGSNQNLSVVVNNLPSATVTPTGATTFCNGGNVVLNANSGTGYTYQWKYNNANISGSTSSAHTASQAGNYSVQITDANGCSALSSPIAINVNTLPSVQSSQVNVPCSGSPIGEISITSTGAAPFTYTWDNLSTATPTVTNLSPGTYIVQVTDANGCVKADTTVIIQDNLPMPSQPLADVCAVTVDSATGKNLIIWEKLGVRHASQYNLYRESAVAGQYTLLGTSPSGQLSTFLDTSSVPLQQSYRYKISETDSCSNEFILSNHHKTIHLTANIGISGEVNLLWNPYEGKSYSSHYIMRSHNNGPFVVIAQVSSSTTSYSDLTPPTGNKLYRIDIDISSICNPTAKTTAYSFVSSNTVTVDPLDAHDLNLSKVKIVPNPTTGFVNIIGMSPSRVKISDVLGRLLMDRKDVNQVNITEFSSGTYLIQLFDRNGHLFHQQKVIKQ